MRHWFLSYNSKDSALIQAIETALREKDLGSTIFYAPKSLRAGGYWLPELAKEIAAATAFVLVVGREGPGPWQIIEYYEALDRRVKESDFPVMLILLDGQPAPGLPFLRQLHWIVTEDPASEQSIGQLIDAAAAGIGLGPREPWRHTAPYRGLAAMTEADSDFFFGRVPETVEILRTLEATPDRLPILVGNSGVGKSSLAQAGVLAALARQAWPAHAKDVGPWPKAFETSRSWCYLTMRPGAEPIKALIDPFLTTWQFEATDPLWATRQKEWIEALRDGNLTLRDLLDATERRYGELGQLKPPAFFLYIDQGEELYVRSEERQRQRFSEIIAEALSDPRLHVLMSLRADFFGSLQGDEVLYKAHRLINCAPLREPQLVEVVSRPAALLSARFETDSLAGKIAQRTAQESVKDAGALPLLSYLLDDMWAKMVSRGDGMLRLPEEAFELGRVLAERAEDFLDSHPGSKELLQRILTLKLATVRDDGEPSRRRAARSEFSDKEWRLVSELTDHPNRLLVTATPEIGETYAEVAHEAIFRHWKQLRDWIVQQREFLIWRSALERDYRAWVDAPEGAKNDALLMGFKLNQAQDWLQKRAQDISKVEWEFIDAGRHRARNQKIRRWAVVGGFAILITAGLMGWWKEASIKEYWSWFRDIRPYLLTAEAERALRPGDSFTECTYCPEMVLVPPGEFTMGSAGQKVGDPTNASPLHSVKIKKPFAVSRFEVTFDDWDACAALGNCSRVSDAGWGRGRRPVINVTWEDAKQYVAWLSKITGKEYRLLSESEWEYAARAGSQQAFTWGDKIPSGYANCSGCGSEWGGKRTAPVEADGKPTYPANRFGLNDMHGNIWEWVEDCWVFNYNGNQPSDEKARTGGDCREHVARGGSWNDPADFARSAERYGWFTDYRVNYLGFRVARTLGQ